MPPWINTHPNFLHFESAAAGRWRKGFQSLPAGRDNCHCAGWAGAAGENLARQWLCSIPQPEYCWGFQPTRCWRPFPQGRRLWQRGKKAPCPGAGANSEKIPEKEASGLCPSKGMHRHFPHQSTNYHTASTGSAHRRRQILLPRTGRRG